jgi:Tol biopolymer transport system component
LDVNPDIWAIAIDHASLKVSGEMQPVLNDKHWESRPALDANGTTLVFRTERAGGWDFSMKNLSTGEVTSLTNSAGNKVWAAISRDGARIAYHTLDKVALTETATGNVRTLCSGCRMQVADWTPDGKSVVAYNLESKALEIVDASDGRRTEILKFPGAVIQSAKLSPDAKSIAVLADSIFVAPFRGEGAIDPGAAKLVATDAEETIRWSPDGQAIYFISAREGPTCLWAVRPDHPGDVRPVMHFHQRRRALLGSFDVAPGRLYIGIHETKGNVWIGKLGR